MITVPILEKDFNNIVIGMAKVYNDTLVIRFAYSVSKEEIERVFGRVSFRGIPNEKGEYFDIQILSWSF